MISEQQQSTKLFYDSIWVRYSHSAVLSAKLSHLKQLFLDRGIAIKGKKVLDCGSGSGMTSIAFALLGAKMVVGVDQSVQAIKSGRSLAKQYHLRNTRFYQRDILKYLKLDRNFGVIYSFGVLHHTTDPYLAFKNIVRHARVGGIVLVGLYLKTRLTPLWTLLNRLYRKEPYIIRRLIFWLSYFIILSVDLLSKREGILRDHSIAQQIDDWFAAPTRFHYTIEEAKQWFKQCGLRPLFVVSQVARFRSSTNFVIAGRKKQSP